jgi:rhomboid family GlyGly-CTERM serine protease
MSRAPWTWTALCLLLAAGTALAWLVRNPVGWEWWREDADLAFTWWTAALVHRSAAHGVANVLALGALAVLGQALRVPLAGTLALVLAWPMSTLGLWLFPQIGRYAGLSGVLHAAVAVLIVHCTLQRGLQPWAGLLGAGLGLKLLVEAAWRQPLVFEPAWGFTVATAAHLTGALAGASAALLAYGAYGVARIFFTRAVVE